MAPPRPIPDPPSPAARSRGAAAPARPRLVVSRCLDLDACRYNGARIGAPFVARLARHVDLVAVCPEVDVGLGVPRDPVRLVRGEGGTRLVQPATGRDLTGAMRGFAARFLEGLEAVDGFLLKSRSPSCGVDDVKVYTAPRSTSPVDGEPGMFAAAVLARFPHHPVEHEGRLADHAVRDRWLTALFAMAALRRAREEGGAAGLKAFHRRYELMLSLAAPADREALERVVANRGGRPPRAWWDAYARGFARALPSSVDPGADAAVLRRAAERFGSRVPTPERRRFEARLDAWQAGRLARWVPLSVLRSWVRRYGEPWLADQAWMAPYPRSLAEPSSDTREAGDA